MNVTISLTVSQYFNPKQVLSKCHSLFSVLTDPILYQPVYQLHPRQYILNASECGLYISTVQYYAAYDDHQSYMKYSHFCNNRISKGTMYVYHLIYKKVNLDLNFGFVSFTKFLNLLSIIYIYIYIFIPQVPDINFTYFNRLLCWPASLRYILSPPATRYVLSCLTRYVPSS